MTSGLRAQGLLGGRPRLIRQLQRLRGSAIILLCLGCAAGLAISVYDVHRTRQHNTAIAALAAGVDVAVSSEAPTEVLFARAQFLLTRGRFDDVYPLLEAIAWRGADDARADLLYNIANARLRVAYDHLERHEISAAVPHVNLAKDDLRAALRIAPAAWDFKHNLDVAMQLVRDFPRAAPGFGEEQPETPEELWTDLPGIPRGLP